MNLHLCVNNFNQLFTNERIEADFHSWLRDNTTAEETTFELSEGDKVIISQNTPVTIVTLGLIVEHFDVGFGTGARVMVALGGIDSVENGIVSAHICFATLYYNYQEEIITVDLHRAMW